MEKKDFLLIALALVAALGLFFVFVATKDKNEAEVLQEEDSGKEITEITDTTGVLPRQLNLSFSDEIPAPNNPCYSLEIDEAIKEKRSEFANRTVNAQRQTEQLLQEYDLPLEIYRGRDDGRHVALTIDTGIGGAYGIEEILQIARHYNIKLTFFVTGCWVLENPTSTQKIFIEGHTIGNHSLTHLNLAGASDEEAEREISETDRLLKDVLGFKPVFFRKPQYAGGARINEIASELGKIVIQGHPDLGDTTGWRIGSTREQVLSIVRNNTEPGAIWVLHNLSPADLRAFEDIVRFHLEEGYVLVSVEDILP